MVVVFGRGIVEVCVAVGVRADGVVAVVAVLEPRGVVEVRVGFVSVVVGVVVEPLGPVVAVGPVVPDAPLGPLVPVTGTTGAGAVSVGVVCDTGASSSPVSFTNANANSAPAMSISAPSATVGSCQFGVGARRVRAGAPHSKHQSCSGPIVAEQRGQRIAPAGGTGGCPPGATGG